MQGVRQHGENQFAAISCLDYFLNRRGRTFKTTALFLTSLIMRASSEKKQALFLAIEGVTVTCERMRRIFEPSSPELFMGNLAVVIELSIAKL